MKNKQEVRKPDTLTGGRAFHREETSEEDPRAGGTSRTWLGNTGGQLPWA